MCDVFGRRGIFLLQRFQEHDYIDFNTVGPSGAYADWMAVREHQRREVLGKRGEMSGDWKRENEVGWREKGGSDGR